MSATLFQVLIRQRHRSFQIEPKNQYLIDNDTRAGVANYLCVHGRFILVFKKCINVHQNNTRVSV